MSTRTGAQPTRAARLTRRERATANDVPRPSTLPRHSSTFTGRFSIVYGFASARPHFRSVSGSM